MKYILILVIGFLFIACDKNHNKSNEEKLLDSLIINKKNEFDRESFFNKKFYGNTTTSRIKTLNKFYDFWLDGQLNYCDSIIELYKVTYNDSVSIRRIDYMKNHSNTNESEIKILQLFMLSNIKSYYYNKKFTSSGIIAYVNHKEKISVNDTLETQFGLLMSNLYKEYYVVINNDTLKNFNPTYKEKFEKTGVYKRNGKIVYDFNKVLSLDYTYTVEVTP